jgi:hypothetical protein
MIYSSQLARMSHWQRTIPLPHSSNQAVMRLTGRAAVQFRFTEPETINGVAYTVIGIVEPHLNDRCYFTLTRVNDRRREGTQSAYEVINDRYEAYLHGEATALINSTELDDACEEARDIVRQMVRTVFHNAKTSRNRLQNTVDYTTLEASTLRGSSGMYSLVSGPGFYEKQLAAAEVMMATLPEILNPFLAIYGDVRTWVREETQRLLAKEEAK